MLLQIHLFNTAKNAKWLERSNELDNSWKYALVHLLIDSIIYRENRRKIAKQYNWPIELKSNE